MCRRRNARNDEKARGERGGGREREAVRARLGADEGRAVMLRYAEQYLRWDDPAVAWRPLQKLTSETFTFGAGKRVYATAHPPVRALDATTRSEWHMAGKNCVSDGNTRHLADKGLRRSTFFGLHALAA